MVDMYTYLIMKGRRTYKSVPNCLKRRVKKILVELGLEELAAEEEQMEQFLKLLDTGFTFAFAAGACVFVFKYAPLLLNAWMNFNKPIGRNTEITNRHYDETVDLKRRLLDLEEKLEHHNTNALDLQRDHDEILKDQEEMLKTLGEMKQIILGGGRRYD